MAMSHGVGPTGMVATIRFDVVSIFRTDDVPGLLTNTNEPSSVEADPDVPPVTAIVVTTALVDMSTATTLPVCDVYAKEPFGVIERYVDRPPVGIDATIIIVEVLTMETTLWAQ